MKLLSIIIPSYNMESWLDACLGSLSDWMDGGPVEVIVVNDGSTDRTSEIAHGYASRYPEVVKVVDKPNGHYGSAVNAGLAAATGLYVKNLDADDSFDPKGLGKLLAEIESDRQVGRQVDLYLTPFDVVDKLGRTLRRETYDLPSDRPIGLAEILSGTKEISMHACAWRLGLLREMGYRQSEGISYSDVEWILYPMLKAQVIRYLPQRVYLYLLGRAGQSVSLAGRRRNADSWDVILARIFDVIRTQGAELSPDASAYLRRVAIDMARMYLETAFVLKSVGNARIVLPKLLSDLEMVEKGLGLRLEDEARIMKSSLNVPYLRIWRKLPVGKTAWMLMVRSYLAGTRVVRFRV